MSDEQKVFKAGDRFQVNDDTAEAIDALFRLIASNDDLIESVGERNRKLKQQASDILCAVIPEAQGWECVYDRLDRKITVLYRP